MKKMNIIKIIICIISLMIFSNFAYSQIELFNNSDVFMVDNNVDRLYFLLSNDSYSSNNRDTCDNPLSIAIDSNRNIFVACANTGNNLIRFNHSNNYTGYDIIYSSAPNTPLWVTVDYDNNIWIRDNETYLSKINVTDGSKIINTSIVGGYTAIDGYGNIWDMDTTNLQLYMLNKSNNYSLDFNKSMASGYQYIAITPNQDIWIVDRTNNKISRFLYNESYNRHINYTTGGSPNIPAIDLNGSIWLPPDSTSSIYYYDSSLDYSSSIYNGKTNQVRGTAIDKYNDLWVSYNLDSEVSRFAYNNSYSRIEYSVGGSRLRRMAINRLIDIHLLYGYNGSYAPPPIEIINDTEAPNVTLIYPINDTVYYNYNGSIIISINESGNCILNNSNWYLNYSTSTLFHFKNNTVLNYGIYNLSYNCSDNYNNSVGGIFGFTHLLNDTIAPLISNLYPSMNDTTYYIYNGSLIINTSENSTCIINNSLWKLNQSNGTLFHFKNISNIDYGEYDLLFSCNDTSINKNSNSLNIVFKYRLKYLLSLFYPENNTLFTNITPFQNFIIVEGNKNYSSCNISNNDFYFSTLDSLPKKYYFYNNTIISGLVNYSITVNCTDYENETDLLYFKFQINENYSFGEITKVSLDLASSFILFAVIGLYILLLYMTFKTQNPAIAVFCSVFGLFMILWLWNSTDFPRILSAVFGIFNGYILFGLKLNSSL